MLARECRSVLLDGKDPIDARKAVRLKDALQRARSMTFEQCAAAYIDAHRSSLKNARHADQWKSTLATYASPIIGALPVADVDTDLLVKVLSRIWGAKTETATRVCGRIESILEWATVSKFRQGDNPARWRGHLANLLANPNNIAPVRNHPALPWRDVPTFMALLAQCPGVAARAAEFAILTSARSGEVRAASWEEVELNKSLWTIPAVRMKAGNEHRVFLSTAAVGLLAAIRCREGLIFPGRSQSVALSDMSLAAVLRRMGRGDIPIHGFRSSFRDWCAEAVGNSSPREVCEHALAHSLPDRVEAAYRRRDLFEKRIVLMADWADYCTRNI